MEKEFFSFTGNCLTNADVEPLLQKIMAVVEEQQFSRAMAHNIRTVASEIIGNIASHAFLKEDSQRSISIALATTDEGNIVIRSRNFIPNDSVGSFTILLNNINLKNQQELKELQQKTLENNLDYAGSPHIGIIMIRRKCCKPIVCKFEPYDETLSYISLELELKNLQDDLKKEATKRTPQVKFDIASQTFEISGVSFPEDAENYYSEIENWIMDNETFISELQNPVIKIDLEYFNSISLKNIVRTIRALLESNKDKFTVNWYYDVDDEIAHEEGIEMSEILHKDFNFIPKN